MLTLWPGVQAPRGTARPTGLVRSRSRSLAELLPWLSLYGDDLVLCKDGSLLACLELGGLDADALDLVGAARAAEAMEHALRALDERFTLWSVFQRRRIHGYEPGEFPHPVTARIDALHGERFRAGDQFANRHVLALLFSPAQEDQAWQAIIDLLRRGRLRGVWSAVVAACDRTRRIAAIWSALEGHRDVFVAHLDAFCTALGSLGLRRLSGSALLTFLNGCASPTSDGRALRPPGAALLLDAFLGEDQIEVGHDRLRFAGAAGQRQVAALGVKAWPDSTVPGLIDGLMRIPNELCVAQVFRFVPTDVAKAHIQSVQRFHLNLERSAFSFVREAVFGEAGQVHDGTRAVSADEARLALTELAQHRQVYGYFNLSVLVSVERGEELDPALRAAAAVIREAGFLVLREGLHLLSAWTGMLPGQWSQLVRWHFIHTGNLADLLPLNSPGTGDARNAHLSAQLGVSCAALAVLPGVDQTAFRFNFHWGDLGHCFVVGPSRSGKSMLVNFLLAQFRRYPGARIMIFDKDRSGRIATLLQGGRHLDPGRSGNLRCNPLWALDSEGGAAWLPGWLRRVLCTHGLPWQASDDLALAEALEGLRLLPASQRQLSTLHALLPPRLAAELAPWVGVGPHAHLFDHAEDGFACHGLCCIEMGEILRDEALARLFLDYAVARIDAELAAQATAPTVIYIEEAWFMLAHPEFRERIRDWLKTLPKRLALVVLATQSLDDLSASPAFSAIADNVPTRIFLPNRNATAQAALYQGQFGLNAAQVRRIARAESKRQFLVVNPRQSRFVDLVFPPETVAILRSDRHAQEVFDEARRSHPDDWARIYLERIGSEHE